MSTGLSSLIGQYMSDSENEDERSCTTNTIDNNKQSVTTLSVKNGLESFSPPITSWTQCVDPATDHPYYWNIETKEVTWEKPNEYDVYINYINEKIPHIPDNCWVIGYTEGDNTPYYVNEYTRVVSWKKPPNFKEPSQYTHVLDINAEKIASQERKKLTGKGNELLDVDKTYKSKISKSQQNEEPKQNLKNKKFKIYKNESKSVPKYLENNSDDEKIELINSYSAPSESSSDEEVKKNPEDQKAETSTHLHKKLNKKVALVAAYETDDESDSEGEENSRKSQPKSVSSIDKPSVVIDNSKSKEIAKELDGRDSPHIQVDSFASIITGGKSSTVIDEEINRLKMELEKDLPAFESSMQKSNNENNENGSQLKIISSKENNFDEKAFQRKRRIQLGAATKITDVLSMPVAESETTSQSSNTERLKEIQKKNLYSNFVSSHIEFGSDSKEKSEDTSDSCSKIEKSENDDDNSDSNDDSKSQITNLSDLIMGKVKFLSVGRPEVSAVQIMSIQLEALLSAYRSSSLNSDYFFKWLKTTSDDLKNLEQSAAPDNWECNWDRQSSQYFYKNLETGEIRWEFPVNEQKKEENVEVGKNNEDENNDNDEQCELNVRGEDEMDISTTPPPNEHEQIRFTRAYPIDETWKADNESFSVISSEPQPSTPTDINCELASFYSDLATLETTSKDDSSPPVPPPPPSLSGTTFTVASDDNRSLSPKPSANDLKQKKKSMDNDDNGIPKKKRKKIKVQGMGQKMKEVSTLVAKWQKVQKELDS